MKGMKEGETRNFVATDEDGNDCGDVELIHCGNIGVIGHFKGDGFDYSNGFPNEAFAMSSFLSCVAGGMRRKAEELRELADKLDGRKLE